MVNLLKIANRIKVNEGYRNHIYKDQLGNPTIGYGHLITSKDYFLTKKKYSKKKLLNLFKKDLMKAASLFKKNYNYKSLSTNTQEVLIEIVYQLGIKKLLKFKKLNLYIKQKQFYLASLEMMRSRWYKQTPKRVNKLIIILLKSHEQ